MKKKILTLFLATVLSVSSVMTAFAGSNPSPDTNSSASTNDPEFEEGKGDTTVIIASEDSVSVVNENVAVEGFEGKLTASTAINETDLKVVEESVASKDLKGTQHVAFNFSLAGFVNESVTVKVTLPVFNELFGAKYVETFRVEGTILVSLGTSEVIDGKFTFTTDHFSTYVFVARDSAITDNGSSNNGSNAGNSSDSGSGSDNAGSNGTGSGSNNGADNGNAAGSSETSSNTPSTGDTTPVALLFAVACVALVGIVCASKKKRA